jgi:predicted transcriptional regulator of viral defense system
MTTAAHVKAISEIAASQRGLFTTAQAALFGVSRSVLAYMTKVGKIERLEHGVYKVSGTPFEEDQGIYAAWLSTDPARMAFERRSDFDGVVVGGRSAAAIHGIGDFFLSPYRFLTRERINSKRSGIVFTKRTVDDRDVTFTAAGLPITSVERTLFDLHVDSEEPSLFNDAVVDATERHVPLDESRIRFLFAKSPIQPDGPGEEYLWRIISESDN